MERISLKKISERYTTQEIEKHLVFYFLKSNSLTFDGNRSLHDYFLNFKKKEELLQLVASLDHNSIEDLASDMELLIPDEDKKLNGAFFTPTYIVDYIINTISPKQDSRIIDLSCGSGAFLLGIVRYMCKKYGKTAKQSIKENVFGIDILPYNTVRSRLLLMLSALTEGDNIDEEDINVYCDNSLKREWTTTYDYVVGNPPYVKFQDMEDQLRNYLMDNFTTTTFGTFNLYFAFFELGIRLLNQDGKLGYITPNNYFTSLAGECLRSYFQKNQYIYKIVDFSSIKVFDVQTYTSITFLNKHQNSYIAYSRIGKKEMPQQFLWNNSATPNSYKLLSEKKWRLLCDEERHNIENIENSGETIGSLFNICVGIATLKDEVFFVTPYNEDTLYYYITRDNIVYKIEKEITRPLVKISDIKYQEDIKRNERRIIFPYMEIQGRTIPIPQVEMERKYPFCYAYLLSVKTILDNRGKGKHVYTPFYVYGRTQGINRKGVKLLTPTFSKAPRFILDTNDMSFFTNGYGIYMRQEKSASLFPSSTIASSQNWDVIQKILNSIIMEYYVEKTSVAIEGGYPCYQKNFIERFSIPSFSEEEIENIRQTKDKSEVDSILIEKYQLNLPVPKRCS